MVYLDEDTRINSDQYQFIIEKRSITKTGTNAGKENWTDSTFHPTVSNLLERALKDKLFDIPKKKKMDLEEFLEQVSKEIKKFDKLIKESALLNSKILPEIKKVVKDTKK